MLESFADWMGSGYEEWCGNGEAYSCSWLFVLDDGLTADVGVSSG
jgi:hypothetical protein